LISCAMMDFFARTIGRMEREWRKSRGKSRDMPGRGRKAGLFAEGFLEEAVLLFLVDGLGAARRTRCGRPSRVADAQFGQLLEIGAHDGPRHHVVRLFLAPDSFRGNRIARRYLYVPLGMEGIDLLETNDRGVANIVLAAVVEEIVVDLAGAEDQ